MSDQKVTIETHQNGWEEYVVGDRFHRAQDTDTAAEFMLMSRDYAAIAKFLDSDEQREHQRIKNLRRTIADRYGVRHHSGEPANSMVDRILELEEAARKAANPDPAAKLVKRPTTAGDDLLGLDDNGGH